MKNPEMGEGGPKTPEKTKTVRDIKNQFIAKFGEADKWTDAQKVLWGKLNRLGGRNIDKKPLESIPDIDADEQLSAKEIRDLEDEISGMEKKPQFESSDNNIIRERGEEFRNESGDTIDIYELSLPDEELKKAMVYIVGQQGLSFFEDINDAKRLKTKLEDPEIKKRTIEIGEEIAKLVKEWEELTK